jgi:hypothetical protein
MTTPEDNTTHRPDIARMAHDDETSYGGVLGGDAEERMDAAGDNLGRGADGDTAAREQLRVDLGERPADADREA